MKNIKFEKTYHGFEAVSDLGRDIDEMWQYELKDIPGEFQGTIKVTVEYIPSEDENRAYRLAMVKAWRARRRSDCQG